MNIYHMVPKDLFMNSLVPLFNLEKVNKTLYEKAVSKYDDHPERKKLPFKRIPRLNCRRGDVIHCSSIHPSLIYAAYKSVFPNTAYSMRFYKIPLERICHLEMAMFDMNRPGYEFGMAEDPESVFEIIDVDKYREPCAVPAEAISFYKMFKKNGKTGAPLFAKIPHVFVKGQIDIDGVEVLDWLD